MTAVTEDTQPGVPPLERRVGYLERTLDEVRTSVADLARRLRRIEAKVFGAVVVAEVLVRTVDRLLHHYL